MVLNLQTRLGLDSSVFSSYKVGHMAALWPVRLIILHLAVLNNSFLHLSNSEFWNRVLSLNYNSIALATSLTITVTSSNLALLACHLCLHTTCVCGNSVLIRINVLAATYFGVPNRTEYC